MKRAKKGRCTKWISLMVTALFLVTLNLSSVMAAGSATTKIKHKPIKHFVAGKRIQVQADVKDKQGVELVRCYFKAKEAADFVFVPMTYKDKNTFAATLPAPSKETQEIDYLFLSVNADNVIVKTQVFTASRDEDSKFAGADAYDGEIDVFSEVTSAPTPQGFADSIVVDVIESSARFGIVAGGLYAETAGASGAAASASSVGAITAGAGLSTTAIVAGGVALAAGAGAAAAGGGGGDDDGGGGETLISVTGTWNYVSSKSDCTNKAEGIMTFTLSNGNWTAKVQGENLLTNCNVSDANCTDNGYVERNPMSKGEFQAGIDAWGCVPLKYQVTEYTENRIVFSNSQYGFTFVLTR